MKLFLTSSGLANPSISDTLISTLSMPLSEARALVVAYAQNSEEESYVEASRQELEYLGFEDISVANMHYELAVSEFGDFDMIYVCGGNTFAILAKMRERGLTDFISTQVRKGAVYVGVSAGSIIATKTIESAGWGSEGDENAVGLQDLRGLDFVDISIFPHYRDELKGEVNGFREKAGHVVYELRDGEAVVVDEGGVVKII